MNTCSPAGSSPRVRGTHGARDRWRRRSRFIPACAGNAAADSGVGAARAVHPRVCGERAVEAASFALSGGSSPRVRGTLHRVERGVRRERFIPACAGNAPSGDVWTAIATVHPRVCGERRSWAAAMRSSAGSSPRVRGTRPISILGNMLSRFIPACAGNASANRWIASRAAVHPRVCGERGVVGDGELRPNGSSPRVRGTLRLPERVTLRVRFIPACAGNALPRPAWLSRLAVHPRVCGERIRFTWSGSTSAGSSPRVRGTRRSCAVPPLARRFIPACAGNAWRPSTWPSTLPVHPRVCGERGDVAIISSDIHGSSPRVRGTPPAARSAIDILRFIPACAGNAR